MKPPITSITEKTTRKREHILNADNLNKIGYHGFKEVSLLSNDNYPNKFKIPKSRHYSTPKFGLPTGSNIIPKSALSSTSVVVDNCVRPNLNSDFIERQNILRKVCAMKVNNFFSSSLRQEDFATILLKKKITSSINMPSTNIILSEDSNDESVNISADDLSLKNKSIEGSIKSGEIGDEDTSSNFEKFIAQSKPSQSFTSRNLLLLLEYCSDFVRGIHLLLRLKLNGIFEYCWVEIIQKIVWIFLNILGSIKRTCTESQEKFVSVVSSLWARSANAIQSVLSLIRSWIIFIIESIRSFFTSLVSRFRVVVYPSKPIINEVIECSKSLPSPASVTATESILVQEIFVREVISIEISECDELEPPSLESDPVLIQGPVIYTTVSNDFLECDIPPLLPALDTATEIILIDPPFNPKVYIFDVPEYQETQQPVLDDSKKDIQDSNLPIPVVPSQSTPGPATSNAMNASISDSDSDSHTFSVSVSVSRARENSFAYDKIYPDIAEEFNVALSPEHNEELHFPSPIRAAKSRSEESVSYELIYVGKGEDFISTLSNCASASPDFVGFEESKRREQDDIHLSHIYPSGDVLCSPSQLYASLDDRVPHIHPDTHGYRDNDRHIADNFRTGNIVFDNIASNYFYESYIQQHVHNESFVGDAASGFRLSSFQSPDTHENSVCLSGSGSDDSAFMGAAVSSEEQMVPNSMDGRGIIAESPFVDMAKVYLAGSCDDSFEQEYIIPDLCRTQLANSTGSGYSLRNQLVLSGKNMDS